MYFVASVLLNLVLVWVLHVHWDEAGNQQVMSIINTPFTCQNLLRDDGTSFDVEIPFFFGLLRSLNVDYTFDGRHWRKKYDRDGRTLAFGHWLIIKTVFKVLRAFRFVVKYCVLFDDRCDEVILSPSDRYMSRQWKALSCLPVGQFGLTLIGFDIFFHVLIHWC